MREGSPELADRIGIIGGGIVGVALARELVRRGRSDVTLFEKESSLAAHQTGHNSGVVHAGLYYKPGTLKATLCAQGRGMIREFCAEKHLPFRDAGKLVVAVDETEIAALDEIERRSRANQVPRLRRIDDVAELREIEPHVQGVAAVHSPLTAVVDYPAITEALAEDARAGGRDDPARARGARSQDLRRPRLGDHRRGHAGVDTVFVCAGLQSDLLAKKVGADASPKVLPFRGEYWSLDPAAATSSGG